MYSLDPVPLELIFCGMWSVFMTLMNIPRIIYCALCLAQCALMSAQDCAGKIYPERNEDPTQRKDSGKIYTGVLIPGGAERTYEEQGHILAATTLRPGDTFKYKFGYAWSKGNVPRFSDWLNYLSGL